MRKPRTHSDIRPIQKNLHDHTRTKTPETNPNLAQYIHLSNACKKTSQ